MKQTILKTGIAFAASALLGTAMAQPGSVGGQSTTAGDSYSHGSSTSSSSSHDQLSSTGLSSSQKAVRASELLGAKVKGSSGQQIGQIEDAIVNPTSGKIEFAVISRSGMGAAGSTSSTSSGVGSSTTSPGTQTPGTQSRPLSGSGATPSQPGSAGSSSTYGSTSTSTSSGDLVAVPWSLLKSESASTGSSMTSMTSQTRGEQTYTLNVSQSKLDQAPSLTRGSWSEISRPEWRQRVNSHFGVSSAAGGAESPSGMGTGTSSGQSQTLPESDTQD